MSNENKPNGDQGGEGKGAGKAGAPAANSGAALSPAATPPVATAGKSGGKGAKAPKGSPKAGVRLFYRDAKSTKAELRNGKFFEVGDDLTDVDAEHLAEMDAAGQLAAAE